MQKYHSTVHLTCINAENLTAVIYSTEQYFSCMTRYFIINIISINNLVVVALIIYPLWNRDSEQHL